MSTLKSSSTDLTLNADGVGNDIIFQSNAGQIGSLTAEGVLTATTFTGASTDSTKLPLAGGTMTGDILHAGNFTINTDGNIALDNGSNNVVLLKDGAQYGLLTNSGGNLVIKSGSTTALSFANAAATFASTIDVSGNAQFRQGITEQETAKTSSFTPNLSTDGTIFDVSGSITITMPSATAGKSFTIIDSGSGTLSWSGTIKWPSGTAPSPSGATIYSFISNGTNWYGMMAGTGFA